MNLTEHKSLDHENYIYVSSLFAVKPPIGSRHERNHHAWITLDYAVYKLALGATPQNSW